MDRPGLIIFDCDGTLVDSERLYNTVISDMLTERGYGRYTPQECLIHFTGLTFTNIAQKLAAEEGADFSFLTRGDYIARAQEKMDQGLNAMPGAPELVRACTASVKTCVASNGERSSVIKSLKITGLFDSFGEERIYTKSQVREGKPAPDLFLFATEKMGCNPAHCLVIEDSVPGVHAAVAAGMEVYGFTGSHHDPHSHEKILKAAGASRVYDSLIHILENLRQQKSFSGPASCAS